MKKRKTIFDLPLYENKEKFQELSNLIYSILGSDSFSELSAKAIVPIGSTQKDMQELLKKNAPNKAKQILDFLLVDNLDAIIKGSSISCCEDVEKYKKKSVNEICRDYMTLSKENASKLMNFFTHAGR